MPAGNGLASIGVHPAAVGSCSVMRPTADRRHAASEGLDASWPQNAACSAVSQPRVTKRRYYQPVWRSVGVFGLDRRMWQPDWTRAIGLPQIEQGVTPVREATRLSPGDKAASLAISRIASA